MIPWQILADGDGNSNKGFKGEWMTVKDRKLYVGGIGMEYVLPNGAIASEGGKFVKIIDHTGCQIDWKSDFNFFQAWWNM